MNLTSRKPNLEGLSPAFTPYRSADAPAFNVDLRRSLQMHRGLAVVCGLVVMALLLLAGFSQRRQYKAQSLIYVQPTITKALSDSAASYDAQRYDSYMQQQLETLTRQDILAKAIETLPPGTWRGDTESLESAAGRLSGALKVSRLTTSYQIQVAMTGPDPRKAAAIVNAVTSTYLREGRRDELAQTDQRMQVLGDERERVLLALQGARHEQASLSASLGTARPGLDNSNPYDASLTGLRADLAAAREAHDLAAAQLASLNSPGSVRSAGLTAATDEAIALDAGLNSMKGTISQRRATLSSQMAGLTPNNPVYRQDQEEIAQLDRSLDQMTETLRAKSAVHLQDKLRLELARTGDLESRLNTELARQAAAATGAAPKLQRAADLAADVTRLQTRLATVEDSLRGLQLETNSPGTAHLALAASVPTSPEMSRVRLLLLAALPLGIVAGILAATLAKRLDGRLYIASEVEQVLGFLPLAVLPASEDVSTEVKHAYLLRLAAGIEHALRISNARTFVITAVSASAEISSMVVAVQAQLESMGVRARVVRTAELLTPDTQSQDGSRTGGLMRAENSSAMQKRRESFAMSNLQRMGRDSDLLLIEAAPITISAETEYISRSADATILITDSGVTLREDLLQAASLLQRLNARGVGTVIQGLRLRFADPLYARSVAALERQAKVRDAADPRQRSASSAASTTMHAGPEIVEAPLPEMTEAEDESHQSVNSASEARKVRPASLWQVRSRFDESSLGATSTEDLSETKAERSSAAS